MFGTVDGNRTRRSLIDSEISPPGGLYGINLVRVSGFEPESLSWQPRIITWLYYTRILEHRARFELAVLQFCRLLRWASPPPVHCLERVGRVELRNISLEDCRAPLATIYPHKNGAAAGVEPSAGI